MGNNGNGKSNKRRYVWGIIALVVMVIGSGPTLLRTYGKALEDKFPFLKEDVVQQATEESMVGASLAPQALASPTVPTSTFEVTIPAPDVLATATTAISAATPTVIVATATAVATSTPPKPTATATAVKPKATPKPTKVAATPTAVPEEEWSVVENPSNGKPIAIIAENGYCTGKNLENAVSDVNSYYKLKLSAEKIRKANGIDLGKVKKGTRLKIQ